MAAPKAKPAAGAAKAKVKTRKKEKKNVAFGHAYIKSTFNNTIVSITDPTGAVLSWASSGGVGFKVHVNQHHSPRSLLLNLLPRRRRSMA